MNERLMIDHPDLRALHEHFRCPFCGCPRPMGVQVRIEKKEPRHYHIWFNCLRCGANEGRCCWTSDYAPGEFERLEREQAEQWRYEPVGADELIEVHAMSLERFENAWAELVKPDPWTGQ